MKQLYEYLIDDINDIDPDDWDYALFGIDKEEANVIIKYDDERDLKEITRGITIKNEDLQEVDLFDHIKNNEYDKRCRYVVILMSSMGYIDAYVLDSPDGIADEDIYEKWDAREGGFDLREFVKFATDILDIDKHYVESFIHK